MNKSITLTNEVMKTRADFSDLSSVLSLMDDDLKARAVKQHGAENLEAFVSWARLSNRSVNPEGSFDNAGRWYPDEDERCSCCAGIREPSRSHPYSLMVHCRSKQHVATKHGIHPSDIDGVAYCVIRERLYRTLNLLMDFAERRSLEPDFETLRSLIFRTDESVSRMMSGHYDDRRVFEAIAADGMGA